MEKENKRKHQNKSWIDTSKQQKNHNMHVCPISILSWKKKTVFVFSSSNVMARKNVTLKRMTEIRNHQVCPLVVHMAEASSPSDWSGHELCSHSRPQKSSWAGQNVPCMSNKSLCVGWPATPICWCQRVQCQCIWTEDALADCGCCICLSLLMATKKIPLKSGGIERRKSRTTAII